MPLQPLVDRLVGHAQVRVARERRDDARHAGITDPAAEVRLPARRRAAEAAEGQRGAAICRLSRNAIDLLGACAFWCTHTRWRRETSGGCTSSKGKGGVRAEDGDKQLRERESSDCDSVTAIRVRI